MTSHEAASETHTRTSLIARLRHGDPQAWHQMVDLYAPLVHQWCRRCGVGADASADVMQEVFAAAARHIERFTYRQAGDTFRGWLWTVTRNKVRDHHRNQRRQFEPRGGSTALQLGCADRGCSVPAAGVERSLSGARNEQGADCDPVRGGEHSGSPNA